MSIDRIKFAERFNEVAKQLGYDGFGSQSKIARDYGLKQPSTKKWFDGDAMPEYEICIDLCKRAKVSFEWFMTGRGSKTLDNYIIKDSRIEHIIKIMQELPDYKVDQAVSIIDTIAKPTPSNGTNSP